MTRTTGSPIWLRRKRYLLRMSFHAPNARDGRLAGHGTALLVLPSAGLCMWTRLLAKCPSMLARVHILTSLITLAVGLASATLMRFLLGCTLPTTSRRAQRHKRQRDCPPR